MTCVFLIGVVLLSWAMQTTFATLGVDVASEVSQATWQCMKREGYNFAIVRVFRSIGQVDQAGAESIKNARAAGIQHVDGYLFPNQDIGNARKQVRDTINHLQNEGADIGRLWLDVEDPKVWSTDSEKNAHFIQELVDECKSLEKPVGIYTLGEHWATITGDSEAFSDLELWYAHNDTKANFDDFKSFGGWETPAIKQFHLDRKVCGVDSDKNWYPD